jgi:hypothetical protein
MSKFKPKLPPIVLLGFLIVLMAGLCSGCSVLVPPPTPMPTATATQTHTPTATVDWFPATATPTGTPRATATPQPTLPDQKAGVGGLLVSDDFTDLALWATRQGQSGNIAFGNNNLTLALAQEDVYLSSRSQHPLPQNFYLEMTIETSLCFPEDQFGLLFWQQSEGDFYRLSLSCASEYRLELIQGGQSVVLRNWENAARMQPGAPAENRVGLWVHQGQFRLYINDVFQFEEKLAQDRDGLLGVFGRTASNAALTVKFSDLQIYEVIVE